MSGNATISYHLHDTAEPVVKFYPEGIEGHASPYAAVDIARGLTLFVNSPQQAKAMAAAFADVAARFAEVSPS